ncbi:MAG: PucR family transcriptional regulator [Pseudonocardiaceae bacterium]|nr:PucR family transcriptional regulator [Pseudonocardiaceae bacterium]
MEPTVSGLAGMTRLGLTLRAAERAAGRRISWVHASELRDPTPFLQGGELLLTTGIALPENTAGQAEYVDRLAAAGLAGLGFGIELGYDRIPAPVLDATERAGLPLLEVPHRTPFIEISKAVSQAIAEQARADTVRGEAARQALTKAALNCNDLGGVVGELAGLLNAWAVLLDSAGRVLSARPGHAAERVAGLAGDLDRLRAMRMPASAGVGGHAEDSVAVQSLGGGNGPLGFLVIGRACSLSATDHHIMHVASSLLTVALTQTRAVATAGGRLRSAALRLLINGQRVGLDVFGELGARFPGEPVRVFVSADPGTDAGLPDDTVFGELDGQLVVIARQHSEVRRLASGAGGSVGVSEPVGLAELGTGLRQARMALRDGLRRGAATTEFTELGVGLLEHVGQPDVAERAHALLRPLFEHDRVRRGELLASLRVWLDHHGQWDPAASKLGVHRHTLRHRMTKVGELVGRSLESPDVRGELWLALRLHDNVDC